MNLEPVVINYLIGKLNITSVYGEVPETPVGDYIVVDKTGSDVENRITTSTIAIQSYSPTKASASELNDSVKAAMDEIIELRAIDDCQLMSDYNFSNPEKKDHRYQAVFEITHR